jgi:transcriptional activator TraM
MDQAKIIPLISKKHGVRVGADDPIWLMGTAVEEVNKETVAEIRKMLTDQLDQISAANLQAENAAKARGEKLITEGTEWATKKIREAGEAAAARVNTEVEKALADAKKGLNRAVALAWICAGSAVAASASAIVLLWFW